jgi:hypothetical protein
MTTIPRRSERLALKNKVLNEVVAFHYAYYKFVKALDIKDESDKLEIFCNVLQSIEDDFGTIEESIIMKARQRAKAYLQSSYPEEYDKVVGYSRDMGLDYNVILRRKVSKIDYVLSFLEDF